MRGRALGEFLTKAWEGDPVAMAILGFVVGAVIIYFAYSYLKRQNETVDELFGSPDHGSFPDRDNSK